MTPDERRRYGRQIRLAEIGDAGQERICAASAPLTTVGFARTVEESYLRAAGLTVLGEGSREERAPDLGLRNPAAREVGEGALAALLAFRAALGARS